MAQTVKQRIADAKARLKYYDSLDVEPLANVTYNKLVRSLGVLVLNVVSFIPPIAVMGLMFWLMLGSIEVLSGGQPITWGIAGIWIIIQAGSVDGLLLSSVIMAIINKGYNRIPYIVIDILLFLTSWFIVAVYTWNLLAHITFAWVRSFITVFIAVVDVIYIGVGYNKTFGMRLPGGIWQSFSDMLARLFDKVGNSQVVTLQQNLNATLNKTPTLAQRMLQHNTQHNMTATGLTTGVKSYCHCTQLTQRWVSQSCVLSQNINVRCV